MRVVSAHPPTATGVHDGLPWARFDPAGGASAALGGVVTLHGAGSRGENHFDFCRACASGGLSALAFDARGHGDAAGDLGAGAVSDVAAMADVLRSALAPGAPVGLRGSSMGGYLALVAARSAGAGAVVAICPASAEGLRRGLAEDRFAFRADRPGLDGLLAVADETAAARALDVPLLLLHAAGDEVVPVQHSRDLAEVAPDVKFVELPGGHHRSIQHDAELLGVSVRFLRRALRGRTTR